jgi:hypothetical protein
MDFSSFEKAIRSYQRVMDSELAYEVKLVTSQPNQHESAPMFWMYRMFQKKDEAIAAANLISEFYPSNSFANQVIVTEFDVVRLVSDGKGTSPAGEIIETLANGRILNTIDLKNENGDVVTGDVYEEWKRDV